MVARVPSGRGRRAIAGPRLRLASGLAADPGDHLRDVVPADPTGQLTGIFVAQRGVLDLGDHRDALAQGAHPSLGALEIVIAQRCADGELE